MDKNWEHVVVLGAAGKMGSGIALLLLQEIAFKAQGVLTLLDTNRHAFEGLKKYLREHLLKYAERNINRLRVHYQKRAELIANADMIDTFVEEGLDNLRFVTTIEECHGASLIFEAIVEDVEVKASVFSKLDAVAESGAHYFSNTSSIPIHVLQERSHLQGRLTGFHFYNPPAVQKLLEIIVPDGAQKEAVELSLDIGKRLNKTIVFSKDIAGFIGNGHFMVEKLKEKKGLAAAICLVNSVTRDDLIRPMGIFQLIDYVGIDVVRNIAKVMTAYLPGQIFTTALIETMVLADVRGGQNSDGSQKDGFFSYEKGTPMKVYDLENHNYIPYIASAEMQGHDTWKTLGKDKNKREKMDKHFANLLADKSATSKLAIHFLENSRIIAHNLVKDGVARSIEDVNTVLQNGFFHLYGVDDPWQEAGRRE